VTVDEGGTLGSSSSRSSRTLIRQFHVLLKRRVQLQSEAQDAQNIQSLADVEREVERLGGLDAYQRMSTIGQGNDRGGGSEQILISWLKEMNLSERTGCTKLRYTLSWLLKMHLS
jgi:25S rRNA (adenine2142-N1)-methyltransferase